MTLIKNILRQYGRAKEKRRNIYRAIEQMGRILHTTGAALKETRLLSYNKTTNYF